MKAPAPLVSTVSRFGLGRSNAGRAAMRSASGCATGTRAPSHRRIPLALLAALAVIASFAFTAASASAAPYRAVIGPISNVSYTSAHVTGEVDGAGEFVPFYFQYSTDEVNWTTSNVQFTPSNSLEPVSDEITGLRGGTEYFVRLVVENCCGGVEAVSSTPDAEFETLAVQAPTVLKANDASEVKNISALATGEIERPTNPDPAFDTNCHFEYVSDAQFAANGFQGAELASCGIDSLTTPGEKEVVEAKLTGLKSATKYHLRLTATDAGPGASLEANAFTTITLLPTIKSVSGASDGNGGYTLQGVVNSNSSLLVDCKFVYGPNSATEPDEYAFAVPCSPTPGEVNKPVTVEGHVTGLTPGATYHSRLVVTNAAGTEVTDDQLFEPTLDAAEPCPENEQLRVENNSLALPECRAYEMVSPPNKAGGEAFLGATGIVKMFFGSQFEGESVAYNSTATNIANSGQGAALGNNYVADRRSAGWETIPNLNGPNGSLNASPYELFGTILTPTVFSEDLQSSMWYAAPGGDSAEDDHAYLRNPDGSFTLIGNGVNPRGSVELANPNFNPLVGVSADLSRVVFNGASHHANPEEPGDIYGPGVYEFVGTGNDQPRRVDVDNSGEALSTCGFSDRVGTAHGNMVSADGRVIVFAVAGGCGGDNPTANELWARVGGTTSVDVSASQCTRVDCNAPAEAVYQGAAKDGSRVYFTTTQQLVDDDTDETNDLYACDIPQGTLAPTATANSCSSLSQVSAGDPAGAEVEEVSAVSKDGSTVYFLAKGVLATNPGALGESAAPGGHNLYVWHKDAAHPTGQTTFVATLAEADLGSDANAGAQNAPSITPEGRYLAFTTATPLVNTDTDSARDAYRYDSATEKLVRVSVNVSGVGGNGEGFELFQRAGLISNDGEEILFRTNEPLSPLDGNGEQDLYLWKAGHVSLISTGTVGGGASFGVAIDGSGRDIFFETRQQLVPSDGDDVTDVYDARVGGGFSAATPTSCSGEGCQAPPSPPPAAPNAPANLPNGSGNLKPKQCPKGKVARGERCVKKSHKRHSGKKHHSKKHKRVGSNSGGGK